jgi:hypothetical protein
LNRHWGTRDEGAASHYRNFGCDWFRRWLFRDDTHVAAGDRADHRGGHLQFPHHDPERIVGGGTISVSGAQIASLTATSFQATVTIPTSGSYNLARDFLSEPSRTLIHPPMRNR